MKVSPVNELQGQVQTNTLKKIERDKPNERTQYQHVQKKFMYQN